MATEANASKEQPNLEVTENDDGSAVVHIPDDDAGGTTHQDASTDADDADGDDRAPVTGRADHDDDDGPTEAEELRTAANDAAREAIRARRRAERKTKKADAQDRERNLKAQLSAAEAQLRVVSEKVNLMERKSSGTELAQLDHALGQANAAVDHFKNLMAEAGKAGNSAMVSEATEKWVESRDRVRDLSSVRARLANPPAQAAVLDPQLVLHANNWMQKNPWYNPRNPDTDSHVVLALDKAIFDEGITPNTPRYWEELDKRVAKYLPHRAARGGGGGANSDIVPTDGNRKPGRSVVTGSGRGAAVSSGSATGFVLSQARVQALKDAGMWEDPVQRSAMIKDYREHDRKAAEANKS